MYDSKYFHDELFTLLFKISKKKNWNIDSLIDLFKDGIKINFEENNNDTICHGAVIFNGTKRRCCRNKKIENLCGLHFNKKKRYGIIDVITFNVCKIIVFNKNEYLLINPEKKKKISWSNQKKIKNFENSNEDEYWREITLGLRTLYLNNTDNYVYTEVFGEFSPIGIYDRYNNTFHEL